MLFLLIDLSLSLSFSPEAIDTISTDGTDIPDIAAFTDTACSCQKHGAIDGQVQMIKCNLKARMTSSRCLHITFCPVSNQSLGTDQLTNWVILLKSAFQLILIFYDHLLIHRQKD